MKKIFIGFLILFSITSVSCKTVDPIGESSTGFPVPFARKYSDKFYTSDRKSQYDDLASMIDPESIKNFNEEEMRLILKKRSHIGSYGVEKYGLEIIKELSPDEKYRFVYFLKKEDFAFLSSRYRSIRIERVICVKRDIEWFVYIPEGDLSLGIETVYRGKVKDLPTHEEQAEFFRDIIENDYEKARVVIFSREKPDATRAEIIEELINKAIDLYDMEKYRDALRLFKKAFRISDRSSQKAEAYIKRCQKAIEMGL